MLLEIAVFNYSSAIIAYENGADRIELCDNATEGGTTPSYGTLKLVRQKVNIPVFPIIRARGGDFLYSDDEFEIMRKDVTLCKELGFEGIVFGMLNANGTVDKERCARIVEQAYPMSVTFHRAFDRCADPFDALEEIIAIGCERILTSGQVPVATSNLSLIAELIIKADERITIMPGSGARSDNIISIAQQTGAKEFHSSARINVASKMEYSNAAMNEKEETIAVNAEEVKRMKEFLQGLETRQ